MPFEEEGKTLGPRLQTRSNDSPSAFGHSETDTMSARSIPYITARDILEEDRSKEGDSLACGSPQCLAESDVLDINEPMRQLYQCVCCPNAVFPCGAKHCGIASHLSSLDLSRPTHTPSLRADSIATARTETPDLEDLKHFDDAKTSLLKRSTPLARETHLYPPSAPKIGGLPQKSSDSFVAAWTSEVTALSGESTITAASGVSEVSSLTTVGTCPGYPHPSTIPGGKSSTLPPLYIIVRQSGECKGEGFMGTQDSGADVNVMKESIWTRLGEPCLHPSEVRGIHGLGGRVEVCGRFKLCFTIQTYKDRPFKTEFQVVPDDCMDVDALLCGHFIESLPPLSESMF